MECGDENTKFFQAFFEGRKQQNTIWELKKANNELANSIEDLIEIGKAYFDNMFRANQQVTIAEVIQISQYFLESIIEEDNLDIMERTQKKT